MKEKQYKNIIISQKVRSCWSGSYAEVSAKFSKTGVASPYKEYEVDGFSIYVDPDIPFTKETVTLKYEKMLIFDRIIIDGAPI